MIFSASLGAFVSRSATFGGLSGKHNLQDTDGDRDLEHQCRDWKQQDRAGSCVNGGGAPSSRER